MSQASMNREGLSQQSLVITAPNYHKRYILPGGESFPNAVPNFSEMNKVKNRTAQMHQAFSGKNLQSMKPRCILLTFFLAEMIFHWQ
jgi:hypothetical protein